MKLKVKRLPLRTQVMRSAQAIESGLEIVELIEGEKAALVRTAKAGLPPVGAISLALQARFPDQMKAMAVRQFVGTAVKSVLDGAGYEVEQSGVRLIADPVFKTGSVYRKAGGVVNLQAEVLGQLIEGLSVQNRRTLMRVLQRSLGISDESE